MLLRLLRKIKADIITTAIITTMTVIGRMNPDELEDFTGVEEDETGVGVGCVKGCVEGKVKVEPLGCGLEPIEPD